MDSEEDQGSGAESKYLQSDVVVKAPQGDLKGEYGSSQYPEGQHDCVHAHSHALQPEKQDAWQHTQSHRDEEDTAGEQAHQKDCDGASFSPHDHPGASARYDRPRLGGSHAPMKTMHAQKKAMSESRKSRVRKRKVLPPEATRTYNRGEQLGDGDVSDVFDQNWGNSPDSESSMENHRQTPGLRQPLQDVFCDSASEADIVPQEISSAKEAEEDQQVGSGGSVSVHEDEDTELHENDSEGGQGTYRKRVLNDDDDNDEADHHDRNKAVLNKDTANVGATLAMKAAGANTGFHITKYGDKLVITKKRVFHDTDDDNPKQAHVLHDSNVALTYNKLGSSDLRHKEETETRQVLSEDEMLEERARLGLDVEHDDEMTEEEAEEAFQELLNARPAEHMLQGGKKYGEYDLVGNMHKGDADLLEDYEAYEKWRNSSRGKAKVQHDGSRDNSKMQTVFGDDPNDTFISSESRTDSTESSADHKQNDEGELATDNADADPQILVSEEELLDHTTLDLDEAAELCGHEKRTTETKHKRKGHLLHPNELNSHLLTTRARDGAVKGNLVKRNLREETCKTLVWDRCSSGRRDATFHLSPDGNLTVDILSKNQRPRMTTKVFSSGQFAAYMAHLFSGQRQPSASLCIVHAGQRVEPIRDATTGRDLFGIVQDLSSMNRSLFVTYADGAEALKQQAYMHTNMYANFPGMPMSPVGQVKLRVSTPSYLDKKLSNLDSERPNMDDDDDINTHVYVTLRNNGTQVIALWEEGELAVPVQQVSDLVALVAPILDMDTAAAQLSVACCETKAEGKMSQRSFQGDDARKGRSSKFIAYKNVSEHVMHSIGNITAAQFFLLAKECESRTELCMVLHTSSPPSSAVSKQCNTEMLSTQSGHSKSKISHHNAVLDDSSLVTQDEIMLRASMPLSFGRAPRQGKREDFGENSQRMEGGGSHVPDQFGKDSQSSILCDQFPGISDVQMLLEWTLDSKFADISDDDILRMSCKEVCVYASRLLQHSGQVCMGELDFSAVHIAVRNVEHSYAMVLEEKRKYVLLCDEAYPDLLVKYARLKSEMHDDVDGAARTYLTSLQCNVDNVPALVGYAELSKYKYKQTEAAMRLLKHALALPHDKVSPDVLASLHYNYGTSECMEGHVDSAYAHYAQALSYLPVHSGALCNMGVILKSQEVYAEAENCFRAVIAFIPENPIRVNLTEVNGFLRNLNVINISNNSRSSISSSDSGILSSTGAGCATIFAQHQVKFPHMFADAYSYPDSQELIKAAAITSMCQLADLYIQRQVNLTKAEALLRHVINATGGSLMGPAMHYELPDQAAADPPIMARKTGDVLDTDEAEVDTAQNMFHEGSSSRHEDHQGQDKKVRHIYVEAARLLGDLLSGPERRAYIDARRHYLRALQVDPLNVEALNSWGIFLSNVGHQFDEAVEVFDKALSLQPNSRNALLNRAMLYGSHVHEGTTNQKEHGNRLLDLQGSGGDGDRKITNWRQYRALNAWNRVLNMYPDDVEIQFAYAAYEHDVNFNLTAAEHAYQRILEIDPLHLQTLCNYGALLHNQDDSENAEIMYQRALNLSPADSDILTNYGALLYEFRNDIKGAESMYRRALRCNCCVRVRHVHQDWCSLCRIETLYRALQLFNLSDGLRCEGYVQEEGNKQETDYLTSSWALVCICLLHFGMYLDGMAMDSQKNKCAIFDDLILYKQGHIFSDMQNLILFLCPCICNKIVSYP